MQPLESCHSGPLAVTRGIRRLSELGPRPRRTRNWKSKVTRYRDSSTQYLVTKGISDRRPSRPPSLRLGVSDYWKSKVTRYRDSSTQYLVTKGISDRRPSRPPSLRLGVSDSESVSIMNRPAYPPGGRRPAQALMLKMEERKQKSRRSAWAQWVGANAAGRAGGRGGLHRQSAVSS